MPEPACASVHPPLASEACLTLGRPWGEGKDTPDHAGRSLRWALHWGCPDTERIRSCWGLAPPDRWAPGVGPGSGTERTPEDPGAGSGVGFVRWGGRLLREGPEAAGLGTTQAAHPAHEALGALPGGLVPEGGGGGWEGVDGGGRCAGVGSVGRCQRRAVILSRALWLRLPCRRYGNGPAGLRFRDLGEKMLSQVPVVGIEPVPPLRQLIRYLCHGILHRPFQHEDAPWRERRNGEPDAGLGPAARRCPPASITAWAEAQRPHSGLLHCLVARVRLQCRLRLWAFKRGKWCLRVRGAQRGAHGAGGLLIEVVLQLHRPGLQPSKQLAEGVRRQYTSNPRGHLEVVVVPAVGRRLGHANGQQTVDQLLHKLLCLLRHQRHVPL
mmetsp:Transcript_109161/g.189133  ORF Transcript_109161/g.189133 Transcript_109161/m.189133 type:complete len:382 (+) Transcript_109161:668-1813(+)